jgi:processive 1,2-diacylglycerol beta-glucosyltransferase
MFERVLILSVSAGAGHLRAAEAVEKAVVQTGAARQVLNVDTLRYTNKLFQNLYSKAYIEVVNKAPDLLGWLYDSLDKPWKNERRRLAFDRLNTRPFIKMLKDFQPDVAVCTHFLPAEIISHLKEKGVLQTRQAVVITDLDVHAMWLYRQVEHYFVAMEETKAHLEELGIPSHTITVSGIPIDPVFAQLKDKARMRAKYGLDPGLATVLVSAGGFGVGPVEQLVQSLGKMTRPIQVIAICGRNEALKTRMGQLSQAMPASSKVRIHPMGYTRDMDEYMAASDLVLGKPGGLTTSEALAKGLGLVIVNPIQGQEERNSDHLLEEGAAIRCNNLPVLGWKIDRLLDEPGRLTQLQANARRLGRPRAALDIVEVLQTLLG